MVLELSLACQSNDRTRALLDGRVAIEGCAVTHVAGHAEEIFQRAFRHCEFDISELSFSTHLLTTARGEGPYIGIPAFVSRSFRHSSIYIRNDRGIDSPAGLKGRQIGVPDFQQTAGVWVRGMLAEEYGVHPGEIRWRTGGLEQAGRKPRMPLRLPPEISVEPIPEGKTLAGMLAKGELDAVISPRAPSCYGRTNSVVRLFPEFRKTEEHYFAKTGLFPIMHLIGIRRELAQKHPWLAMNVYKALVKSKALAFEELKLVDTMRVAHPWLAEEIGRVQALMGEDYWRYGVKENGREIGALVKYAAADGLISQEIGPEELFDSTTADELRF
jgi:4,5-dihydroxyphthalate decarboxylase